MFVIFLNFDPPLQTYSIKEMISGMQQLIFILFLRVLSFYIVVTKDCKILLKVRTTMFSPKIFLKQ